MDTGQSSPAEPASVISIVSFMPASYLFDSK